MPAHSGTVSGTDGSASTANAIHTVLVALFCHSMAAPVLCGILCTCAGHETLMSSLFIVCVCTCMCAHTPTSPIHLHTISHLLTAPLTPSQSPYALLLAASTLTKLVTRSATNLTVQDRLQLSQLGRWLVWEIDYTASVVSLQGAMSCSTLEGSCTLLRLLHRHWFR